MQQQQQQQKPPGHHQSTLLQHQPTGDQDQQKENIGNKKWCKFFYSFKFLGRNKCFGGWVPYARNRFFQARNTNFKLKEV
eukprot:2694121-Amphidinium_carterae.1